jgi:uncharacterized protein YrzB (UPF0473 family)
MTDAAQDSTVEEIDWEDTPTVSLEDAKGNISRFEMLAILEVDDGAYAVLTPVDAESDADAPLEIQILHYDESDDGTFSLRSVEDDALAEQLFEVVSETLTQAAEE